ncbi:MAG: ABC transporter ATP-binding protein [Gemmatimonadetes bacterium]|nr:ABC transporter ATP-binding protein [Gemmatimonadota bacterium]
MRNEEREEPPPHGGAGGDPAVIEAQGLVKEYPYPGGEDGEGGDGVVRALRGVDLLVQAGEWVAIMGPSGCGKSTLLSLLAGIDDPTTGEMVLLGQRLQGLPERARSRLRLREVGFIFQRFHLLSVLTAAENVELPMSEAGVPRAERRARTRELLDYVGLAGRASHRPPQLSGGEQQRVAIARALANRPRLLLADEPTGELDMRTGEEILALFERLNREQQTTLVVVTHDAAVARRARRTVEMRDGRVVRDTVQGDPLTPQPGRPPPPAPPPNSGEGRTKLFNLPPELGGEVASPSEPDGGRSAEPGSRR